MSDMQFALLLATLVSLIMASYFLIWGIASLIYRHVIATKIIRSFRASTYVQEQLKNASYETIKQHGGRVQYREYLLGEYTKKYLETHHKKPEKE
jgi:hypothetical protein